ncbi:hypothetical protein RLOC_00007757 [Lonchura striata]|uniref:Uncharacterized protein n=1 Tax=Lonchura striata TaxID=40157 RepID=A0A218UYT6_9PASE|nr:hypothetical protein RLOC_00007757 [Lonchura striata domestica]
MLGPWIRADLSLFLALGILSSVREKKRGFCQPGPGKELERNVNNSLFLLFTLFIDMFCHHSSFSAHQWVRCFYFKTNEIGLYNALYKESDVFEINQLSSIHQAFLLEFFHSCPVSTATLTSINDVYILSSVYIHLGK